LTDSEQGGQQPRTHHDVPMHGDLQHDIPMEQPNVAGRPMYDKYPVRTHELTLPCHDTSCLNHAKRRHVFDSQFNSKLLTTQGCNKHIALQPGPGAMAGRDTSRSCSSPPDVLGPWRGTPGHDTASYGNWLDSDTSTAVPDFRAVPGQRTCQAHCWVHVATTPLGHGDPFRAGVPSGHLETGWRCQTQEARS
jgi:hypothetical protein